MGRSRKQTLALSLFSASALLIAFQNCSDFASTAREDSLNYMSTHPVLATRNNFTFVDDGPVTTTSGTTTSGPNTPGTTKNDDGSGSGSHGTGGTTSATGTSSGGNTAGTTPTPSPTAASDKPTPVTLICSNYYSNYSGVNIMKAIRLGQTAQIAYFDSNNQAHCAQTVDLPSVISKMMLTLPACPELSGQTAGINIFTGPAIPAQAPVYTAGSPRSITLLAPVDFPMLPTSTPAPDTSSPSTYYYDQAQFDFKGTPSLVSHAQTTFQYLEHLSPESAGRLQILYALNRADNNVPADFAASDFGDQARCDGTASPLILQLPPAGQEPQPVTLTSIDDGVLFDILGANNFPVAHQEMKISWLVRSSLSENYFLTLPNENGEVTGIDQLFGNNTQGPDGKFAANGYEALRKYDFNGDGEINRKDPIFWRLRLWSDQNGDGIAQPNELHKLTELNVRSISLSYDPNFQETDSHGNVVKYKSIVTTMDGEMHLAFDIWFKLLTPHL